jgi:Ca2+-binding RTX toxin-like protein
MATVDRGAKGMIHASKARALTGRGLAFAVLAFLCLVLPNSRAEARAPSCGGKRATITSDDPRIVGKTGNDVIVAGPGRQAIRGMGGNDTICGGRGGDRIYGGRGNDDLSGGLGDDTLDGERGSDDLEGSKGKDLLLGSSGNDELRGGAGNHDDLDGGPGDDSLAGGDGGFDVLTGGPGNDAIDGGPGIHDIASYAGTGGAVAIDLEAGLVSGAEGERLSGIEDAVGSSGDDTLDGAAGSANRLDGGPGDDSIVAIGPADEAYGGPGADSCTGFGTVVFCGPAQSEIDTTVELYASIDGASSLIVTGDDSVDDATVSFAGDTYTVRGQRGGNEILVGDHGAGCARDPGANAVSCRGPIDSIRASLGGGDDALALDPDVPPGVPASIDGGPGSDSLGGGEGDDTIYGGDDQSPDSLSGGGGDDVLYGVNIFHPRNDSGSAWMSGGGGGDLLVGGQPCDGDRFYGGANDNDSASFARVRNDGTYVQATIGGPVVDPDVPACNAGQIDSTIEKIEGSPGPDVLTGDSGANTLLGRGGDDVLDGMGDFDGCDGGAGTNRLANCEYPNWGPRYRANDDAR